MAYDVVVAGGSFAGLITATSIHGRVALVEKGEVGEGQTSACATTLDLVRKLGLDASIEEIHDDAVIHTRRGVIRFPLPYRFCSFDYRSFCRILLERFDGDLITAAAERVRGVDGGGWVVATSASDIEGHAVVDATGWRATLACSVAPGFPPRTAVTYGLEKPALGFSDSGLHFYFDPRVRGDGYAWSFPADSVTRAGVLSYVAADGVKDSTETFLSHEGMYGGRYHGGFLTAGLRPAVVGAGPDQSIFLVGDAAGHCLPLTGEGIRPAAFFAQRLASLLNRELRGEIGRREVVAAYEALQTNYTRRYRLLRGAQRLFRGWPDPPATQIFKRIARQGRLYRWISRRYWDIAAPIEPAADVTAGRAAPQGVRA